MSFTFLDFVIKERNRRDALRQDDINQNRRNVDSSQIPSANVEFIHPKLKDEMSDEEDPENPWVWLTSFSRVPVSIVKNMQRGAKSFTSLMVDLCQDYRQNYFIKKYKAFLRSYLTCLMSLLDNRPNHILPI